MKQLMGNMDAQEWASQFKKTLDRSPSLANDLDWMAGWFANAIMTGYDARESVDHKNKSAVDHPSHYQSTIECIDAIASSMSDEALLGFIKGNVIKYVWREGSKNGLEDLQKARWYLDWYIKRLENDTNPPTL
jgi:hypothetical protein